MAISPKNIYPARVISGDNDYPYGRALNIQGGVEGTGTPLEAEWVNDVWGFQQSLLDAANITPNGQADSVGNSQYLEAIKTIAREPLALKIFQSPTDGGLTEIQTRTIDSGEVYEVRKTSDDSLATIYSDASGVNEVVQNGTDNKSGSEGGVEFYISSGIHYILYNSVKYPFRILTSDIYNENGGNLTVIATGSTTPRTLSDRFADVVNVKDFGAVGDGLTDDSGAIQAAIDSLPNGGKVVSPFSTYRINTAIQMRSNVIFDGDNSKFIIAKAAGPQGMIYQSGFSFVGTCPDNDYITYNKSTGDFFTNSAKPFVDDVDYKEGTVSMYAKNPSDLSNISAGDWVHIGAGLPLWHPAVSEFVKVASANSSTGLLSLQTPTQFRYDNTQYSLAKFIRNYDLTTNPGGGTAGYPDMSTWEDVGFRKVVPVENAHVINVRVEKVTGAVIGYSAVFMTLAVGCSFNGISDTAKIYVTDCQDLNIKFRGLGNNTSTHYPANGSNNIRLDIVTGAPVAIEEGFAKVSGKVEVTNANSFCTFQAYGSYCTDLTISVASAKAVSGIQAYNLRCCSINIGKVTSKNSTLRYGTGDIYKITSGFLPQEFVDGEAGEFFSHGGLRVVGGELECLNSSTYAIESPVYAVEVDGCTINNGVTGKWSGHGRRRDGTSVVKTAYGGLTASTEPVKTGDVYYSYDGAYRCTHYTRDYISGWTGGNNNQIIHNSNNPPVVYQVGNGIKIRLTDGGWHYGTITAYSSGSKIITVSPDWLPDNPPARGVAGSNTLYYWSWVKS